MSNDNDDKNEDQESDELEMVGEGVEDISAGEGTDDDAATGKDEDGVVGDDDDEGGDERVGAGENEDDDDPKAGRREENKTRRKRQRAARERDRKELEYWRGRGEHLEKQVMSMAARMDQGEESTLDSSINRIDSAIKRAEEVHATATTASNGEDATEALRIRDDLRDRKAVLVAQRENFKTRKAAPAPAPAADPETVRLLREWHGRNQWFDFQKRDEDSAIASAIDGVLVREGYSPGTAAYYTELDKRIAVRLPHLASASDDDGDEDNPKPKKKTNGKRGPKFRAPGGRSGLKSNQVHITKERREAMEEAGVWDDPILRARTLKRYAKWDEEHADQI